MQIGFNYPQYMNCDGFNIGPWPGAPANDSSQLSPLWAASLGPNLSRLRELGVSVVRFFLLSNGYNYGPAAQLEGNVWRFSQPEYLDNPKYDHDPDGKVRRFEAHYRLLLQTFKDVSREGPPIKIIPSIISFDALLDPLPKPQERRPDLSFRARGKGDIVEDPDKRKRFIKYVVAKFAELSVPFKDIIYALEVINEPIWDLALVKPMPPKIGNRIIAYDAMKSFLAEACTTIEAAGLESTVGHRFYKDCLSLPTGTVAQFHYYPRHLAADVISRIASPTDPLAMFAGIEIDELVPGDPHVIPRHDDALAKIREAQTALRPGWNKTVAQVMVGEIGSEPQTTDAVFQTHPTTLLQYINPILPSLPSLELSEERMKTHGDSWFELNDQDRRPEDLVYLRLNLLSQKGYPLAAVWPHQSGTNDDIFQKMSPDRWASLRRFTGGKQR